ncbi:expressed protein [Phakopsora pachyrhizi]|uniref:Expressed protein n=1 Tax=Phakopsora pachyrhizi TaxID=170000 RepID=A0AAV0BSD3_PHAPC|nr:expressed protein [Phakopsora pachyrhizi]
MQKIVKNHHKGMNQVIITKAKIDAFQQGELKVSIRILKNMIGFTSQQVLSYYFFKSDELKDLKEKFGLNYKVGVFSDFEKRVINDEVESFKSLFNLSDERFLDFMTSDKSGRSKFTMINSDLVELEAKVDFMSILLNQIAVKLGNRPFKSIYNFLDSAFSKKETEGSWSQEEVEKLIEAIDIERKKSKDKAIKWKLISKTLHRTPVSCRDKWKYIVSKEGINTGKWSKKEEKLLLKIMNDPVKMNDFTTSDGEILDHCKLWMAVSEFMNRKRTWVQCKHKWIDSMFIRQNHFGEIPRYQNKDLLKMVQDLQKNHIDDLDCADQHNRNCPRFDWKKLAKGNPKNYSPTFFQHHYNDLRKYFLKHPMNVEKNLTERQLLMEIERVYTTVLNPKRFSKVVWSLNFKPPYKDKKPTRPTRYKRDYPEDTVFYSATRIINRKTDRPPKRVKLVHNSSPS